MLEKFVDEARNIDVLEVKEESAAGFIISYVQYEKSPIILNFIAQ